MEGLDISKSKWKFSHVDLHMKNCNTTILELKYSHNISIEDCALGVWTFKHVRQVMIKNCINDEPDSEIALHFYNSSGIIENVTISSQNHKTNETAFHIEYSSHVEVTGLIFFNNSIALAHVNLSAFLITDSTVEKNQATSAWRFGYGTIFAIESVIAILNSYFIDNVAKEPTGVIIIEDSFSFYIINCTLKNNKAGKHGGAIAVANSVLEINECIFTDNQAVSKNKSDDCSCILLISSQASVNNSKFINNKGTVVDLFDGNMTVVNSIFLHNSAPYKPAINSVRSYLEVFTSRFEYNDGQLAAVCLTANTTAVLHDCIFFGNSWAAIFGWLSINLTITNSTFQNNFDRGAISMFNNSILSIADTIFLNNSAIPLSNHDAIFTYHTFAGEVPYKDPGQGGAIWMSNSSGTLIQCNFSYGQATSGGALSLTNSSLLINDAMFDNNIAVKSGGAIYNKWDVNVTIDNSIFKNNTVQDLAQGYGGAIYMTNCLNVMIKGSWFDENKSLIGGAIYVCTVSDGSTKAKTCTMTVSNSSFIGNENSCLVIEDNINFECQ